MLEREAITRFALSNIYIRNGSERFNTQRSLAPFGHYFVSSTTCIHQEVWKIQADCARIQLLEFKMPELIFEQMWNTCWVWKQAVGWVTELCGPVSPAIRASIGPAPCSLHVQVIQVQANIHAAALRATREIPTER